MWVPFRWKLSCSWVVKRDEVRVRERGHPAREALEAAGLELPDVGEGRSARAGGARACRILGVFVHLLSPTIRSSVAFSLSSALGAVPTILRAQRRRHDVVPSVENLPLLPNFCTPFCSLSLATLSGKSFGDHCSARLIIPLVAPLACSTVCYLGEYSISSETSLAGKGLEPTAALFYQQLAARDRRHLDRICPFRRLSIHLSF